MKLPKFILPSRYEEKFSIASLREQMHDRVITMLEDHDFPETFTFPPGTDILVDEIPQDVFQEWVDKQEEIWDEDWDEQTRNEELDYFTVNLLKDKNLIREPALEFLNDIIIQTPAEIRGEEEDDDED